MNAEWQQVNVKNLWYLIWMSWNILKYIGNSGFEFFKSLEIKAVIINNHLSYSGQIVDDRWFFYIEKVSLITFSKVLLTINVLDLHHI